MFLEQRLREIPFLLARCLGYEHHSAVARPSLEIICILSFFEALYPI